MDRQKWIAVIGRITPTAPLEFEAVPGAPAGPVRDMAAAPFAPSARLWQREDPRPGRIGVRVVTPVADAPRLAAMLAAAALERGIEPVILSYLELSGFERFGLRVERVTLPQEEDDLAGLWDLATIIDAAEITYLG